MRQQAFASGSIFPRKGTPHRAARPIVCLLALAAALGVISGLPVWASLPCALGTENERMHDSVDWTAMQQHLADGYTAPLDVLEAQGDILRARRLPEDAMDCYNFAVQRGGNATKLLDKLGLAALELKDVPWARMYFKRVVERDRRSADGWNNLGVVEQLNGRYAFAVANYERAVKLDPARAVFHSNLAAAYLALHQQRDARGEIATALRLDPAIFDREGEGAGVAARLLSSDQRARLSFERARLYARTGETEPMLHALAVASEAGMDVSGAMRHDPLLRPYAKDPRVLVMLHNARAVRERSAPVEPAAAALPPLPASAAPSE